VATTGYHEIKKLAELILSSGKELLSDCHQATDRIQLLVVARLKFHPLDGCS
jgi:hypothetical protein